MNRSPFALPWIALAALIAVIAGLVVTVASPAVANAQDDLGATLALNVSAPSAEQPFRTAAVSLDPAGSGLAALGASFVYDTNDVIVSSCAVSEVGACNIKDGRVLISVFNLGGLRANEQLLTINFEPTPNAAATTTFEIVATTAVNSQALQISSISHDSIDVELVATTVGSMTGTVVAAESATALFDIDVCATHDESGVQTCTPTTGLGTWRLDDVATGIYEIVVVDTTGVYASAAEAGLVREGDISSVDEIEMDFVTTQDEELAAVEAVVISETPTNETDSGTTDSGTTDVAPSPVVPDGPLVIAYHASIAGRVTGLQTEAPIVAAQVCATQPLVLHQSCATTDADGEFSLSGLSTGNYWVQVIDPLGQFEQTRPKLVGVVGDDVARTGVKITLVSAAG